MGRPDPITEAVFPDVGPVKAIRLVISHGRDAAAERYFWLPPKLLIKTIAIGRVLFEDSNALRRLGADEPHRVLVHAVFEHGGVANAARALSMSEAPFFHALQNQGVTDSPRTSNAEQTRRSAASRTRNRAAAAEQAIPP
jgi:hypothetical protein